MVSTEVHNTLAHLAQHLHAGRAGEVLPQIIQLTQQAPIASTLQLLGECYLQLNRPGEAVVPLAAATGLTDRAAPATLLATTLMELNRSEEALLIAQRILHRDPRNREALRIMQQSPRP